MFSVLINTKIIFVKQKNRVKNYCYKQKNLNKLKLTDNQCVKFVCQNFDEEKLKKH